MKKHIALLTATAASIMITAGLVSAATIASTTYSPGTTWDVDNVATWATTGNKMDGIKVTAYFNGKDPETKTWADNMGAVGNGWSLTMPVPNAYGFSGYEDNTWYADAWWILSNTGTDAITALVIDGFLGNTVFDVRPEQYGSTTTTGSVEGRSALAKSDVSTYLSVAVEYNNLVSLNGAVPVGDLYQTVTFNFLPNTGYLAAGDSFWFALDTDNVNAVPEPATMLLFGIGAVGLGAFRKRKALNVLIS